VIKKGVKRKQRECQQAGKEEQQVLTEPLVRVEESIAVRHGNVATVGNRGEEKEMVANGKQQRGPQT